MTVPEGAFRSRYEGETVEGFTQKDVKELQEESQREGMMGISPAYSRDKHRAPAVVRRGVEMANGGGPEANAQTAAVFCRAPCHSRRP